MVVVNQAAARELWPGESALGKRVRMEWGPMFEATVVGVVGDVRMKSIDKPSRTTLYWSQAQIPTSFMSLVVKTSVPPASLTPAAIETIQGIDRGIAVEARPLADFVAGTPAAAVVHPRPHPRLRHHRDRAGRGRAVRRGRPGGRGAQPRVRAPHRARRAAAEHPRARVRRGFRWTVIGALVGLPAALAVGRGLGHFLFEISPADPVTYGAVVAILGAAAFAAVALPAWRASRVDPLVVLRGE